MAEHAVKDLRPASVGWDLLVRVLKSKLVVDTPTNRVAECLVGDATGVVVLSARGAEQVELAAGAAAAAAKGGSGSWAGAGAVLRLRNARVDMYRGSMRLCVVGADGGAMERGEEGSVPRVDEGNNVSLLEFELVQAPHVAFRPAGEALAGAQEAAAAAAAAQAAGGKGGGRKGKGGKGAAAAAGAAEEAGADAENQTPGPEGAAAAAAAAAEGEEEQAAEAAATTAAAGGE